MELKIGRMPKGKLNSIGDVPGVRVGHCTIDNEILGYIAKIHEYKGKQHQCGFSKCTDEGVTEFNEHHGCQGIREYLETGVFPERGRK